MPVAELQFLVEVRWLSAAYKQAGETGHVVDAVGSGKVMRDDDCVALKSAVPTTEREADGVRDGWKGSSSLSFSALDVVARFCWHHADRKTVKKSMYT